MSTTIQPIVRDSEGVVRFKANAIVRYLVDSGKVDLNQIGNMDWPVEDQEQFWMMLGYSVGGYSGLSFVREETLDRVDREGEV